MKDKKQGVVLVFHDKYRQIGFVLLTNLLIIIEHIILTIWQSTSATWIHFSFFFPLSFFHLWTTSCPHCPLDNVLLSSHCPLDNVLLSCPCTPSPLLKPPRSRNSNVRRNTGASQVDTDVVAVGMVRTWLLDTIIHWHKRSMCIPITSVFLFLSSLGGILEWLWRMTNLVGRHIPIKGKKVWFFDDVNYRTCVHTYTPTQKSIFFAFQDFS